MFVRALVIWSCIAAVEVVHGVLRVRVLTPRVGDKRGRQLAVFSGSVLILVIAWLSAPWLGVSSSDEAFAVGALWIVLMLAFEIALGRLVFGVKWKRIAADFDPRQGGLLAIGMAVLFAAPYLAAKWRGAL